MRHSPRHLWQTWPGWSTISANSHSSFTLWFTGLPGTGKTTLAQMVKKVLQARGYKVELLDTQMLSHWLKDELQLKEEVQEDNSHTLGYDAFMTYLCVVLARNGIISITTSVSPYLEARKYAREQIQQFIEVYLHCPDEQRWARLEQQEHIPSMPGDLYQSPSTPELSIDTSQEPVERSALRIINCLEQTGRITPLWSETSNTIGIDDEEIATIKARLQALGYLE